METATAAEPKDTRRYCVAIILTRTKAWTEGELTLYMVNVDAVNRAHAIGLATQAALATNTNAGRAVALVGALENL